MNTTFSRRDLLKSGAGLIVAFALDAAVPRWARAQSSTALGDKPLDPGEVDSFLAIHPDGTVTVYSGKVDVGTGLRIAVAQPGADVHLPRVHRDRAVRVDGEEAVDLARIERLVAESGRTLRARPPRHGRVERKGDDQAGAGFEEIAT